MTEFPSIVTSAWLEDRLDDPRIRIVDVTTYLTQAGATSGQFRTERFAGQVEGPAGGIKGDFFKEVRPDRDGADFAINSTAMRLSIHTDGDGTGHYRFWSGGETYLQSHIPGAAYADIQQFSDQSSPYPYTALAHDDFARVASARGLGEPGTHIVFYDQGVGISFWASRLWWQFRLEGFDSVSVLEGGFGKWQREGRPTRTGEERLAPVAFSGQRRGELIAAVADVERITGGEEGLIVDSLSPADYRGETASYGGRGHIPQSINVYCARHTDERNELREPEVLRQEMEGLGILDESRKVVLYCGGGIGATWNALVLHHLGKKDAAVFDGSMFEWASDPSRPLITEV